MTIVLGAGKLPNTVLLCGEAPGIEEARRGIPFCGRSGSEQESYLARHGLYSRNWYRTNIVKQYIEGNPDPTPELIDTWTPVLLDEIAQCNPQLIVAVGRFAMRWFLGESADLQTCQGLPHRAGAFDSTRRNRVPENCIILPVQHPAAGFYHHESRAIINYGYSQVAEVLRQIKSGVTIHFREDAWDGKETYVDVSGAELSSYLNQSKYSNLQHVGFDTEGYADDPWSIQISPEPGTAYLFRTERSTTDPTDFAIGISAIRSLIDRGVILSCSNIVMHDFEVCRAIGLDLDLASIFDTMYAAYPLCLEPQGLKPLAHRLCGMQMVSHEDTIDALGIELQLEYLAQVVELGAQWPESERRAIIENDGTVSLYKPEPVERTAARILKDYYSGKLDKNGNRTNPRKRWKMIDKEVRRGVESVLGPLPIGSMRKLAQRDFAAAVRYSCRDADAGGRLLPPLSNELHRLGLLDTIVADGMKVLPVFEEMQCTGLPASRRAFESLSERMQQNMWQIQTRLSTTYFGGKPFNPGSRPQVAMLMRRRGLKGEKKTKTGAISTSKKSIEHLRYSDPAIADVFEWREHQHTKDSFCTPILELIPETEDICVVRSELLVSRTTTRRLASKEPNLLAQPKHSVYGEMVRNCYICPEGEIFGEWDFSQIEVRFLAHESRDPLLCELFNAGRDIHTETAMRIFNVSADQVTKIQRFSAKRVTFGVAYGVSGLGLSDQIRSMTGSLDWDETACNKLIREWLKLYKGAAAYFSEVEREIAHIDKPNQPKSPRKWTREPGVIIDCWGMPRYLPAVWSEVPKESAEAKRQAVNHRIQGGAQGLIQKSMIYLRPIIRNLQSAGLKVHWSLQIHDSILLRLDESLYDMVSEIVLDALVNHCGMRLRVPIVAEASKGRTWGELK